MIYWVLYALLAALVLIVAAVLFTKITLEFSASYAQDSPLRFGVAVSLYGGKVKVDIPLDSEEKTTKNNKKNSKKDKKESKNDEKSIKDYIDLLEQARIYLQDAIVTFGLSRPTIRARLHLEMLELDSAYGLGDAAQTGIVTGAAWGALYNLYALLGQVVTLYNHRFNLKPVFNAKGFRFSLAGALRFRLAGLIYIGVVVLVNYLRVSHRRKKNKPARA